MTKHVYVCEKPTLARALFSGLGGTEKQIKEGKSKGYLQMGDHYVVSCVGHMLEQLMPHEHDERYKKWVLDDLPMNIPLKLKIRKDVTALYKVIKEHLRDATVVYNVGDPDDEGQYLIDEILNYENVKVPVKRILISDYNLNKVKAAIANAEDNKKFESLGLVALARSRGDYTFGLNLSRAYTLAARMKGVEGDIRVGRVQTTINNLVNERCLAVENHVPKSFYELYAELDINNIKFKAKYVTQDQDEINDDGKINSRKFAEKIEEICFEEEATITKAIHKEIEKNCPLPYSLSTLSADCARKFKISAKETLAAIQKMYETYKILTYPRTTSKYLGSGHYAEKEEIFSAIVKTSPIFKNVIKNAVSSKKHRAFDDDKIGAHHAIAPTTTNFDFNKLTDIEQKIYNLVARSYIALFYPPSVYSSSEVIVNIAELQFSVKSENKKSNGWESLYSNDHDNPDIEKPLNVKSNLSDLEFNQNGICYAFDIESKKTTPPKYYVASTLERDLTRAVNFVKNHELKSDMLRKFKATDEQGGIGTPATRPDLMAGLFDNGFLLKGKVKGYSEEVIITSKLTKSLLKIIPKSCREVDLTALWISMGFDVEKGIMTVEQFHNQVFEQVKSEVENIKINGIDIESNLEKCPTCSNGFLKLIKTDKGSFFGCTNHPDCKTNFPEYNGKAFTESVICKDCGKPLILRKGKKGYWFGCSGYSDGCKISFDCKNGKPVKKKSRFSKK